MLTILTTTAAELLLTADCAHRRQANRDTSDTNVTVDLCSHLSGKG
jgi:hypothetical protein